jgi:ATP-dependent Clp protease ATP-binding subunit ClpC
MFERFTDRARRVVVLAQEEARRLDHNYIGTEHVLLGLVREGEGVAAMALSSLDISLDEVRRQVEENIGRGQAAPSGHIPFTPRAKKCLELGLREALQLGHNYIGTEHILLGVLRLGEGVAVEVLQNLGADLNRVRQTVIELLSGSTGGAGESAPAAQREVFEAPHATSIRTSGRRRRSKPATDHPLCPSCRASLEESASVRTRELSPADAPSETIKIAYCAECGITLGIKIV